VVANPDVLRFPAPEDEAGFWALLEAAWTPLGPDVLQARQALAVRPAGSRADTSVLAGALQAFLGILTGHCRGLSADELISLDRVLERKLYDIDRADIHAVTGGSDDGFLYARGFVVMGYALKRSSRGQGRSPRTQDRPPQHAPDLCLHSPDLARSSG